MESFGKLSRTGETCGSGVEEPRSDEAVPAHGAPGEGGGRVETGLSSYGDVDL
jgi:hypothetical protein